MRWILTSLLSGALLAGCGGQSPAPSEKAPGEASTETRLVTKRAEVRLSVQTHHGADALSGLRVAGTCSGARVELTVGHAAPYEPLRHTGIAQIDATKPPLRGRLQASCDDGHFEIRRQTFAVRAGSGPLTVRSVHPPVDARVVRIRTLGIE